jgi:prepilin-type N-terminal cleavage/methylation domain-containing protein
MKSTKAFTLIELLIVVAIIAILAAIAVPNFLEAQTRSKVSRMLADMRSIATALEAYQVDNNKYPPADSWALTEEALRLTTTPIAYITSTPIDIFRPNSFLYFEQQIAPSNATIPGSNLAFRDTIFIQESLGYLAMEGPNSRIRTSFASDYQRFKGRIGTNQLVNLTSNPELAFPYGIGFQLRSLGPDRADSQVVPYDATNGTISNGDIMRWGPTNETLSK